MASKEELDASIKSKGDEIRDLKKAGAEKAVIQTAVDQLLALKKQYKEVTGEDWGGAPQGDKKKKKEEGKEPGGATVDAKKAAKEKRMAERLAKASEGAQRAGGGGGAGKAAEGGAADGAAEGAEGTNFGDAPLVQSQALTEKHWVRISELSPDWAGRRVLIRARLHTSRAVGKGCFLLLRQNIHSLQAVLFASQTVSKAMVKYASGLPRESVIDVAGTVGVPSNPIDSATAKLVELHVEEIYGISLAEPILPFLVEDAARPDSEMAEDSEVGITVGMDNRLNFRWIDTRTAANQAIFRIQHGVSQLFREFLTERGFVEIHTPKLLGGASESGSSVFSLNYFGQSACLAQSPQLYKQMACACGDFERVFEIGPVFRAEKSFTHRHLCEFTGLDFEMAIYEHYYEVLDVFSDLFIYIFDNIQTRFAKELEAVNKQHPFEPLQYHRPSLRITFAEGVKLLREAGYDASENEDLDTEKEKALGRIIKEKYKTDFYMMDQYPLSVRPFYTMPSPDNPAMSNSYDMFIRGEEIVSGAQRVHDVKLLTQRCQDLGVPIESLKTYVDSFRYGALPHGGGGIGLERVVMLYLGLGNIRKASLFPRDPKRITP